jgi:putative tryptophan/tyrosine transport system substrate-binding protein
MIPRREFITLLGGAAAAAAWPITARAQQAAMSVVGFVSSAAADASYMAAFRQGLADLGYTEEGRNVAIEFRWADGKFERLPALLADLIQRRAAVIAVGGVTSALAAKAATTTIPIVFLAADDPVKFGLVTSLSRPGGNATGLNLLTSELTTKRLQLIRALVPTASVVAVLVNPRSPESEPQSKDIERAAGAVGQQIRILNASSDQDIDAAFATLVKPRDAALLVTNDALFSSSSRDQIVALAASHGIPTIYDRRAYADAGGAYELWHALSRWPSSPRYLYGKDSQRGKACGVARRTVDQVRAGNQQQNREVAWPRRTRSPARARRRGD